MTTGIAANTAADADDDSLSASLAGDAKPKGAPKAPHGTGLPDAVRSLPRIVTATRNGRAIALHFPLRRVRAPARDMVGIAGRCLVIAHAPIRSRAAVAGLTVSD